jgi:hypothetical protein
MYSKEEINKFQKTTDSFLKELQTARLNDTVGQEFQKKKLKPFAMCCAFMNTRYYISDLTPDL